MRTFPHFGMGITVYAGRVADITTGPWSYLAMFRNEVHAH
jgi:hypothetical protein